ncbi:superoxide dismutase family protein [Clostridium bovifaecis]|uniref:Superoxide dismutase [Cu-Zn] n=1 Tax=Clostridium bovifaecis TaxID=2184719 RepID=A0A6I6EVL0_9CLOT|nr:superoxide dismutase family protein [Clostridium bovifaecis]
MYYNYEMSPYYPYGQAATYYDDFYFRNSQGTALKENWAAATVKGGPLAPNLNGVVYFREVHDGIEVYVYVTGLPEYKPGKGDKPPVGPHGFHIHQNGSCEVGDPKEPFKAAGEHWNPTNQPHGNHAGDFPVLFSNNGIARMSFFTNKFKVGDIIGKSVIIHENPDDYRTQPAGNSGKRLACGVIRAV